MNREELARRIYNGIALSKFLILKEKNGYVDIKQFLEEHEKNWPKYRGDLKQVVRFFYENNSNNTQRTSADVPDYPEMFK